jgi:hypothetical protein
MLDIFSSNIFLAAGDGVPEAYVAAGAAAMGWAAFGASAGAAGMRVEPSGLAAAVSVKQTTALLLHRLPLLLM